MGPLAEFLERVSLFLQGILFWIGPTVDSHCRRVQFGRLSLATRRLDLSRNGNATARGEFFDFRFVIYQVPVADDLDVGQTTSIVEFQKAKSRLRISARTDPALHDRLSTNRSLLTGNGNRERIHTS